VSRPATPLDMPLSVRIWPIKGATDVIGLAQSALLYPPAFSALTRWYGPYRVHALTTLSLAAGLSSTVFAPLTAALVEWLDWRTAYMVLAGILGAITIPLHILGLSLAWPAEESRHPLEPTTSHVHTVLRDQVFSFLVVAMALAAFGMYAANINLVPLLTSQGTSNTLAALALGLSGVGQVWGRLSYPMLTRRTTPRTRTVAVLGAGGVTVALLAVVSHFMAPLLAAAILAGAIRGIYTLLQATAVSDRWGTSRFPTLNGIFSAPTTIAIATAPGGGALRASWLGSYPTAFYVLAILVLIGAATAIGT
jgi:predicted MFS family arabinose efflux permease